MSLVQSRPRVRTKGRTRTTWQGQGPETGSERPSGKAIISPSRAMRKPESSSRASMPAASSFLAGAGSRCLRTAKGRQSGATRTASDSGARLPPASDATSRQRGGASAKRTGTSRSSVARARAAFRMVAPRRRDVLSPSEAAGRTPAHDRRSFGRAALSPSRCMALRGKAELPEGLAGPAVMDSADGEAFPGRLNAAGLANGQGG